LRFVLGVPFLLESDTTGTFHSKSGTGLFPWLLVSFKIKSGAFAVALWHLTAFLRVFASGHHMSAPPDQLYARTCLQVEMTMRRLAADQERLHALWARLSEPWELVQSTRIAIVESRRLLAQNKEGSSVSLRRR